MVQDRVPRAYRHTSLRTIGGLLHYDFLLLAGTKGMESPYSRNLSGSENIGYCRQERVG
jgi:hypothetical protein